MLQGEQLAIAEIVDYECRRGWLRQNNHPALAKLDTAKAALLYVPITTAAMVRAAEFWAAARKGGYATAADQRLDADVILAAQVSTFAHDSTEVIVATMNVGHLSRYVTARKWDEIT